MVRRNTRRRQRKGTYELESSRPVSQFEDAVAYLKTYKDSATGRRQSYVDYEDQRRLSADAIKGIYGSSAGKAQFDKAYKLENANFKIHNFELSYKYASLLIPMIGSVVLFFLLLGFGSAGLNLLFQDNNIYYFLGAIFVVMFLVKKR